MIPQLASIKRNSQDDIRVSASGIVSISMQLPQTSAIAFAQAILSRYKQMPGLRAGLGLVFQQRLPLMMQNVVAVDASRYLSPQLNLTVLNQYSTSTTPQIQQTSNLFQPVRNINNVTPFSHQRLDQNQQFVPILTSNISQNVTHRLLQTFLPVQRTHSFLKQLISESFVQRILTTQHRLDTTIKASSPILTTSRAPAIAPSSLPHLPSVPPVPRVVQRPISKPSGASSQSTLEPPGAVQPSFQKQSFPSWQSPDNTPPIDVNRLTDQVIQKLDRRLLAYRERLGRV